MRIREMKYSDYGLDDKALHHIFEFCRNCQDEKDDALIRKACLDANSVIQQELYCSLRYGKSWERIVAGRWFIPYVKKDFYAYRRKAISVLDKLIKERYTCLDALMP